MGCLTDFYNEEVDFTVGQKPQSKRNPWAGSNLVVSQQMNAILLVKQMDLVACLTVDFFAFLSISVHSKCDFAQPTAFLMGDFYKVCMAQSLKPIV